MLYSRFLSSHKFSKTWRNSGECDIMLPRQNFGFTMKDVIWVGDSREQVRDFPKAVRTKVGEALRVAQNGKKHPKAKPCGLWVQECWRLPFLTIQIHIALSIPSILEIKSMCFIHSRKKFSFGIRTPKREIDLIKQSVKSFVAHFP